MVTPNSYFVNTYCRHEKHKKNHSFLSVSMAASSVGTPYFLGFRQGVGKASTSEASEQEAPERGNAAVLSVEPGRGKPVERRFSTCASKTPLPGLSTDILHFRWWI